MAEKQTRVWIDGCFDMTHYGHVNALRQARQAGDYMIAGVLSDEYISKHKGPSVFNVEERTKMIRAIKWVDEVVENIPTGTTLDTLNKYNCDFLVHGDDIVLDSDGRNSYEKVGIPPSRVRLFKRARGVSTTELIKRILSKEEKISGCESRCLVNNMGEIPFGGNVLAEQKHGFLTTGEITDFYEGREVKSSDRIVYTAGSFDLYHPGHVAFLEKAAKEGDYLIVGVFEDSLIKGRKGPAFPVLTLHERLLMVSSNKHVAKVLVRPDSHITKEFMDYFKINLVVHGKQHLCEKSNTSDTYEIPKRRGQFKILESGSLLTSEVIFQRIISKKLDYKDRNKRKNERERRSDATEEKLILQRSLNIYEMI